jgi:soluble lytic murein transglycosylase-like protein
VSYTSREPYGAPMTPPTARGPDPRAASQASTTLAQGMAEVSGQYARLWSAADQAQAVNDATSRVAGLSMDLADMQRGFEADPDPATAPARFKDRAMEWRAKALEGLDGAVANHVARQLDQLIPNTYRQVAASAYQRHIGGLRGKLSDTLGTHAQAIAGARDETDLLAQVQGIKQSISGNVAAGVIAEAQARPLFSQAVRQAITIQAATDPVRAQALLERFKDEMDAADVAALATGLRAPLERRQGEDAASGAIARSGGAATIVDAIMAQESGGRDGLVSIDGARGRMQIMPGTWAQYAQPGEDIDNPAHNRAVGERIIADLSIKAGGDPARIAVGYFSGPGNIAPPGSPTPWKEDRRDGNGMSVSRYVAQVTARLAPAGTAEAQRDAAIADVRTRLADAPLHVRLSAESQVAQHFSRVDAQTGQLRAALGAELRDLEAAYATGQTGTPIPEARIRTLSASPEAAQRTIDTLTLARTAGDATAAIAFASPEQVLALRQQLVGTEGDTYLAAERGQVLARFDAALRQRQQMLASDPAGYAGQSPEVRALVEAKAPASEIATASLEAQTRMGVRDANLRVLSDSQVTGIAETLRTTGPEKADMAATLAGLQQEFGAELWNRALGELVQHGKIGWEWQAVAAMTAPAQAEGRALLQRALVLMEQKGGREALRKLVAPDVMKGFDGEIDSALSEFREATRLHPGGDALFDTVRRAVDTLATYHAWRGAKAGDAASRAYADVIGARWDLAGDDGSGMFGRTPTMLVPKGQAGTIETALDRVRETLELVDLAALPDPMRPDAPPNERRAATLEAARRGFWINNADASGAVLVGRTPAGSIVNITRPGGAPIEVLFDRLPTVDAPAEAEQREIDDRARARAPRLRQDRP